jgi:hypothetical protein
MVPSFRRNYTTAVNDAIRRTETLFDTVVRTGEGAPPGFPTERTAMPNLNRFPLLGLWAKEAARRVGHPDADAQTIGHAYAVLYAIRANSPVRPVSYKDEEAAESVKKALANQPEVELLEFGGDKLEVSQDPQGRLVGRVGGQLAQTPETYRYKVRGKFPAGYYAKLKDAFRTVLDGIGPKKLDSKLVYGLYDQWKKACAAGRLVDLDKLLQWCRERAPAAK